MAYIIRSRNQTSTGTLSQQRLVHHRNARYLDAWCHDSSGLKRVALGAVRAADIRAKHVNEMALSAAEKCSTTVTELSQKPAQSDYWSDTVGLLRITRVNWDDGNTRKNAKHGVSMAEAEAEQIFFNLPLLLLEDVKHGQREP